MRILACAAPHLSVITNEPARFSLSMPRRPTKHERRTAQTRGTGMEIGIIGLGKMGANIARNLTDGGHRVVGFDMNEAARVAVAEAGIETATSMAELVAALAAPRVLWAMVPSGAITDSVLAEAFELLDEGDIVIDGGNSNYRDSMAHAEQAAEHGVLFLDAGTSGGQSGARNGACIMVGGDRSAYEHVEPMLKDMSCDEGLMYTGRAGSGHFMKMVHNGIEYGMMQAIGEGFAIMEASEFDYDLVQVAHNWNNGSVVRSWLMELMEQQLTAHPGLEDIRGVVDASGEAKWTLETALELEVPAPVIALSLMTRNASKIEDSFANKAVAAMRNGFGGHSYVSK